MKRFGVIFILFLLVTSLFASRANAQIFNPLPNAEDIGKTVDAAAQAGTTNKEIYSVNTQAILAGGVTCMITGCSRNPQSGFSYEKSALAMISGAMASIYSNPPADLALWLKDTGQSLGFIPKTAYAQGIGFTGLSPLLPVWKAFRNIAYLLLALGLIIVGFMVMFRRKIDPKTVVTVQNALPKIVVTMLLITFSYAIAGFMIDLMYLVVAFITAVVGAGFSGASDVVSNFASGGGFITLIGAIFTPVAAMNPAFQIGNDILKGQMGAALTHFLAGALFTISGVGPLLQFIIALAFLFAFIRILLMLLNSYIQILLAVIIGPIQILVDVIPGSTGFGPWIKNLAVNLLTFPITIFMLILGNILFQNTTGGNLWVPPLLPQPLGQINGQTVGGVGGLALSLISLGVILAIPSVVKGLKDALKTQPIVPAGPGTIFSPVSGAFSTTMGVASQFYYGSAMIGQLTKVLSGKKDK